MLIRNKEQISFKLVNNMFSANKFVCSIIVLPKKPNKIADLTFCVNFDSHKQVFGKRWHTWIDRQVKFVQFHLIYLKTIKDTTLII